ncbi:MAG: hypothetical protein IPH16_16970 [Haliscomenobacter sp.]|nr:hypothetical protein [Haliscomenobacter sp.]
MEEIIIQLKDQSKRSFLLELLAQFDFLELAEKKTPERAFLDEGYDFLNPQVFLKEGIFLRIKSEERHGKSRTDPLRYEHPY